MPHVTWIERHGIKQGKTDMATRQLKRLLGPLDEATQSQINALSVEKIEQLGEDLLEFTSLAELQLWLRTHAGQTALANN